MIESNKIAMSTDGEAIAFKGSLGFVLITTNGIIILSCYGQPGGHDTLSFRSEACAFLAVTRLIFLIAEHYNGLITDSIAITTKIYLYTYTFSVIKKLNSMNKYLTAHLKFTLDSE